jgi:DNA-directed RNA polymerase specialized sigma24 family protein
LEIAVPHEGAGPAELVERTEDSAQVIELIERLKPDERDALVLLGLGYSYAEIGELRGWGRAKVHRCLKEGRARVRQSLQRGPT